MRIKTILMVIGVTVVAWTAQAAAPPASLQMIPPAINYQGRLMTPTNTPYSDATHSIVLSLYPTASGETNKLWSERYSVQTRDGYFSVNLGEGGEGLLVPTNLNKAIWQVLWKDVTDASSPNTFFMALALKTDSSGNPLATPVESSPRQQFLTTPFAYRAHQSVYASKADGLFTAGGIYTTNLSATNINTASLSANSINTAGLTVGNGPMFVTRDVAYDYTAILPEFTVPHGFTPGDYDVFVVGWRQVRTSGTRQVTGISMDPQANNATVFVQNGTDGPGTVRIRFLGIRRGLTQSLP
jgi:hypothetical protein